MNLIAYCILCKAPFQTSIFFKYLRFNTLNSLTLCLLLTTRFIQTIYKFDFTNSYAALFYSNYFFTPFLSIFYLNGNLLDTIIILERILTMHSIESVKKVIDSKYFWVFLILFCFIINIPYFMWTVTDYVDIKINNSTLIRNYYTKTTDFANSLFGQIFVIVLFFIRDVITLFSKIILNIISVILMKKYLNQRRLRISNLKTNDAQTINQIENKNIHINKVERNLTYIAIVISILSLVENITFMVSYVYLVLDYNQFGRNLYFFSNLMIAIKHCSNLIIFLYNKLFKEQLLIFIKRQLLNLI